MSNSTELGATYYSYIAYIIEGGIIGPANLLVALSILRYTALRQAKEYVLLMALSIADTINVTAYLFAGVHRLYTHYNYPPDMLVSTRFCLKAPHIILWSFSEINAQLMLVVISVDRLLCVAFPMKYIKLTFKYARWMVTSCYAFTLSMGLVGIYLTYNETQEPRVSPMCGPDVHVWRWERQGAAKFAINLYSIYQNSASQFFAALSIVLYMLVAPIYSYKRNKLPQGSVGEKRKLEQQRKLTKSLAISCLCTLLVFTIPSRFAFLAFSWGMPGLAYGLFTLTINNALCSVIIYELRHPEMRVAFVSMFKRKEMPDNLSLWNLNKVVPANSSHPVRSRRQSDVVRG